MDAERSIPVTALSTSRFAVLLASAMTVSMAYGVMLPFLPFILERVLPPGQSGAVPLHTGLLTVLYTLAMFFLSPLWGVLSDRFNRRIVISLGLIGSGASLILLDNVSSLTLLAVPHNQPRLVKVDEVMHMEKIGFDGRCCLP